MEDRARIAEIFKTIPGEKCHHCGGAGVNPEYPPTVATVMRDVRIAAKMTIRGMADHLGISSVLVSDMEHGRKEWKNEHVRGYLSMVGRAPEETP